MSLTLSPCQVGQARKLQISFAKHLYMTNPSIQKLIDTYKKDLPDYHQEALSSFDWVAISQEVAAKHQLSGRQGDLFIGEVVMMIYQITTADLFKINLMNHVGVSEASAHNIILDVKSRILYWPYWLI